MMNKKLVEIQAEVVALLSRLPHSEDVFRKEIDSARKDPNRDVETLEMLCAALEREVSPRGKSKAPRRPARQ